MLIEWNDIAIINTRLPSTLREAKNHNIQKERMSKVR